MKQMWVSASTPPTSAVGVTPARTRSAPSAMEAAPDAQAMTTVSFGPVSPSRPPRVSAWESGRMERSAPCCRSPTPRRSRGGSGLARAPGRPWLWPARRGRPPSRWRPTLIAVGRHAARARGRGRRHDPHLLHGLQRAQAARSRAVPPLRPRPPGHVDRRGRGLSRPGGRRSRRARGARVYARARRLRHDDGCLPRDGAASGRRGNDPRDGEALGAAGRRPPTVGYVNAHGTGTPQNDRVEALGARAGVRRGRRARQLDQVAGGPHDGGRRQPGGGRRPSWRSARPAPPTANLATRIPR